MEFVRVVQLLELISVAFWSTVTEWYIPHNTIIMTSYILLFVFSTCHSIHSIHTQRTKRYQTSKSGNSTTIETAVVLDRGEAVVVDVVVDEVVDNGNQGDSISTWTTFWSMPVCVCVCVCARMCGRVFCRSIRTLYCLNTCTLYVAYIVYVL